MAEENNEDERIRLKIPEETAEGSAAESALAANIGSFNESLPFIICTN